MHALRRHPVAVLRARRSRIQGFTLVEIMIVVLIIGVLAGIAVPQWIKARTNSRRSTCVANLKRIETAKEQWTMENKKLEGAACIMTDLAPAYIKTTPACPTAGTYTVGTVGTTPVCTVSGHAL